MTEQVPPSPPNTAPRSKTRVVAIVGLIFGVGLLIIASIAAIFWPLLERAGGKARQAQCMSNLRQIGIAIEMYADIYSGRIPRHFEDLRPYINNMDRVLICPSAKDTNGPSYQILLGGQQWNSPDTTNRVVVTESLSNHSGSRNALYGDGRVKLISE